MCASVSDSSTSQDSRQERIAFLNYLFGELPHGLHFELTYIAPPGVEVDGPRIFTESYRLGVDRPDWAKVARLNEAGYGVYYSLTPKKRAVSRGQRSGEGNTALVQVLWVDVDLDDGVYATKDAAIEGIARAVHVPAGAYIDSGGGIHALWVIDPVPVTPDTLPILKATLRGLAKAVRGDLAVSELARVLRLPGTINTKPSRNGARCEVIDILPHTTHLEDYAIYRDTTPERRPMVHVDLPAGARLNLPRWTLDYLDHGAPQGQRNNRLFAAAVEYRSNGFSRADAERDLVARALADGLDESEALRTIASAWRSPHGSPNLPAHIAARIRANEA